MYSLYCITSHHSIRSNLLVTKMMGPRLESYRSLLEEISTSPHAGVNILSTRVPDFYIL